MSNIFGVKTKIQTLLKIQLNMTASSSGKDKNIRQRESLEGRKC